MKTVIYTLVLITTMIGCSSIRTTPIDRLDDDTMVVNPETPLKGVPVALRVPTHLEIQVVEKSYWLKSGIELNSVQRIRQDRKMGTVSGPSIRECRADIKYTERVFVVDPLRPGSGDQEYGFGFTSSGEPGTDPGKGYLKSLNYKSVDTTIKDSATLLAKSLDLIKGLQTDTGDENPTPTGTIVTERVVAFRRFDLNSPNFEAEVSHFLDMHLNGIQ